MKGEVTREMFDFVPEIDFQIGYKYFLGNMDNYKQALLAILKSIKAKLPLLHTMLHTEEFEGLRMITQTVTRMSSNVGAIGISELSYQMEINLLNAEESDLKEALLEYIMELTDFTVHLELLLQNIDIKSTTSNNQNSFRDDFTKTQESLRLSAKLLKRKII
ncbi:MAG: hypothetical protein K0S47_4658 [Herbinix sp.]|jgi:HPt (histidine-containing phosphotransfer) domain-containing protein|nr:hypothetical protein [Herbinix sp.]